tara:strand:- start:392 stop:829 length:438 start_codon:yes stop_codon:yes gene_type:complete
MKLFKIFLTFFLLIFYLISVAHSSESTHSNSNIKEFKKIISGQIDAIKSGDKKIAFSYASKNIKKKFINEDNFYQMIINHYPQIFLSEKFSLGKILNREKNIIQEVKFYTNKLHTSTAYYIFTKNDSNQWKIDGVIVKNSLGRGV